MRSHPETSAQAIYLPDTDRAVSHRLLSEALAAAGVELDASDRHILGWLAECEQAWAVVAGWVTRACEAGQARSAANVAAAINASQLVTVLGALRDAAELRRGLGQNPCLDCDAHPAELCECHATDLCAADTYSRLERALSPSQVGGRS